MESRPPFVRGSQREIVPLSIASVREKKEFQFNNVAVDVLNNA